jgi:hypothetical protein
MTTTMQIVQVVGHWSSIIRVGKCSMTFTVTILIVFTMLKWSQTVVYRLHSLLVISLAPAFGWCRDWFTANIW